MDDLHTPLHTTLWYIIFFSIGVMWLVIKTTFRLPFTMIASLAIYTTIRWLINPEWFHCIINSNIHLQVIRLLSLSQIPSLLLYNAPPTSLHYHSSVSPIPLTHLALSCPQCAAYYNSLPLMTIRRLQFTHGLTNFI